MSNRGMKAEWSTVGACTYDTVSSEHKKHKEVSHLLKSGGGKGGGRMKVTDY